MTSALDSPEEPGADGRPGGGGAGGSQEEAEGVGHMLPCWLPGAALGRRQRYMVSVGWHFWGGAERSTDSMLLCLSPSPGRTRGPELTGSPCPGRPPSRSSQSSRPGTRDARTSSVPSTPEG